MRLSSLRPSWGDSRIQAPWGLSVQGRGVTPMLTRDPYLTNDGPRDCSFFQLKVTQIEQSSHVPETLKIREGMLSPTALSGPSGSESRQKPVSVQLPSGVSHQSSFIRVFLATPVFYERLPGKRYIFESSWLVSLLQTTQRSFSAPGVMRGGKVRQRQRKAHDRCCVIRENTPISSFSSLATLSL